MPEALKKSGSWFCYLTHLHRLYDIAWQPSVKFKTLNFLHSEPEYANI